MASSEPSLRDISQRELEEFLKVLKFGLKNMTRDINQEIADKHFDLHDINRDGVLDLDEFILAFPELYKSQTETGKEILTKEGITKLFKELDANHNDTIEKVEFLPLIRKIAELTIRDIEEIINEKKGAQPANKSCCRIL